MKEQTFSFTADHLAYGRTFTGAPFAEAIYKLKVRLAGPVPSHEKRRLDKQPETILGFESRYVMTDALIGQYGTDCVLEIASGLSPRCFARAKLNLGSKFAEMDLKPVMELKHRIALALCREYHSAYPENLKLFTGDATCTADYDGVRKYFGKGDADGHLRGIAPIPAVGQEDPAGEESARAHRSPWCLHHSRRAPAL